MTWLSHLTGGHALGALLVVNQQVACVFVMQPDLCCTRMNEKVTRLNL